MNDAQQQTTNLRDFSNHLFHIAKATVDKAIEEQAFRDDDLDNLKLIASNIQTIHDRLQLTLNNKRCSLKQLKLQLNEIQPIVELSIVTAILIINNHVQYDKHGKLKSIKFPSQSFESLKVLLEGMREFDGDIMQLLLKPSSRIKEHHTIYRMSDYVGTDHVRH